MVKDCVLCRATPARIRRPATGDPACRECFFHAFENEINDTIVKSDMFGLRGGCEGIKVRVAVAVSGGKDSTVLAHVLQTLNERNSWGLDLFLLAVDEGIKGYRDDSLEVVHKNEKYYNLPLVVTSFKHLYGWTMDEIVATIGKKNNCTFCGVFRRQALEKAALQNNASHLCLGHNADDCAETVLMNLLRGDVARLQRSSGVVTGRGGTLPRCRPLMFALEKEIVMYAHFKKLDYFSTECTYSPNAYRGLVRDFIKRLEATNPQRILDILHSSESMEVDPRSLNACGTVPCDGCGAPTSSHEGNPKRKQPRCSSVQVATQDVARSASTATRMCKACSLVENLNSGVGSSEHCC